MDYPLSYTVYRSQPMDRWFIFHHVQFIDQNTWFIIHHIHFTDQNTWFINHLLWSAVHCAVSISIPYCLLYSKCILFPSQTSMKYRIQYIIKNIIIYHSWNIFTSHHIQFAPVHRLQQSRVYAFYCLRLTTNYSVCPLLITPYNIP